ncbi:MAG: class I SAM-dependent methyltransferase [Pseudodesulfovibrio sp.]
MQITSGIYSILSHPAVYDFLQDVLYGHKGQREYVKTYIRPSKGDRLLDIGCGTGRILRYLPECDYLGADLSERYIARARKRKFSGRTRFISSDINQFLQQSREGFDIIIGYGLLHHLNDGEAQAMIRRAKDSLLPGGRLVTIDGVYHDNQNCISRFMIDRDRGRNVRNEADYRALFNGVFPSLVIDIRTDILRIPYSLIIADACNEPRVEGEAAG